MLLTLTLDAFRSYASPTVLPLGPLTLLAGKNNVGKSSAIAALCALKQSVEQGSGGELLLRGAWTHLGRFDEVVNSGRPKDDFGFSLGLSWHCGPAAPTTGWQESDVEWGFRESKNRNTASLSAITVCADGATAEYRISADREGWLHCQEPPMLWPSTIPADLAEVRGRNLGDAPVAGSLLGPAARLRYLSAYRAPPSAFFNPRDSGLGPHLGRYGEHSAEYLYQERGHRTSLLPPGTKREETFLTQAVNLWNAYIFEATLRFSVSEVERIGFTLDIETDGADRLSLEMVGLGIAQALPILPLVLGSDPGDVIAIETPEAHLHPGAQHRLADLFVEAVRHGRQVLVETHSEHIVNAVRLALKHGRLEPEQVSTLFFEQDHGETVFTEVELDASGRAPVWPDGFFDQATNDLAALL